MANVWFCSDLHFGHENIGKFRSYMGIDSEEENRNRISKDWDRLVTKRDIVYVLGDAAFTMDAVDHFRNLSGTKYLIRGNHDLLNTSAYLKVFKEVYGLLKYKEFWLSHCPIHQDELRGRVNLHGHVHNNSILSNVRQELDNRYLNCCPEHLVPTFGSSLVSLDQIRKHMIK